MKLISPKYQTGLFTAQELAEGIGEVGMGSMVLEGRSRHKENIS